MTILLAEDEPLISKAIETNLLREGYNVICCSDGKNAWSMIEETMPDLVITDILMPYCSGLELTSRIKRGSHHKTPVIVLSSSSQEKVIVEAFGLGADDFIAKPFSFAELSIRVNRLIRQHKHEYSLLAR